MAEARLVNNELQINEAHSNKYVLFLHNIPSSFLLSKFNPYCITPDCQPEGYKEETIREHSNDIRNFMLYLSNADLPDVGVGTARIATKFVDIPHVMGKIAFGDFVTNMVIDENWFNYRMMLYWLYAAHNPHEHNKLSESEYGREFYTSATLILLDNHHQKVQEFEFTDLHPISVGTLPLNEEGSEKLITPITWAHTGFVPSDKFVLKQV